MTHDQEYQRIWKKKNQKRTTDAVEYLKRRADKEIVLKEQELELRKKEYM